MDVWQTVRIFGRRWYVVAPLLILTMLAGARVRDAVAQGYTISASATILPPRAADVQDPDGKRRVVAVNPYLNFTGSTQTTALALTVITQSAAFRETLGADARRVAFAVTVPPRNPILEISVSSTDPNRALRAADQLLQGLRAELDRRQGDAPSTQRLEISVLSAPAVAEVNDAKLRVTAIIGLLGLLSAAAAALVWESVAQVTLRRRRRHASRTSGAVGVHPAGFRPRHVDPSPQA